VPEHAPVPDHAPVPEPEPVPDPAPVPDRAPVPEATPVPDEPSVPGANGELPTRDELTLAWGDRVLTDLRPKVKMLYAAGRFVDHAADGAAFALPNKTHVDRCEPLKGDVEAALAAECGRPIPLVLVVDGAPEADTPPSTAATSPTSAPDPAPAGPAEELADIGPIDELEDAGSASTGLDTVTDVFGAVELIEEDET
jgi:hypothetical protein